MIFQPTTIDGAFLVQLEPKEDERGSFARSFCRRELEAQGIRFEVAQCNLARTKLAGTVRGLHYLAAPSSEQKLVRCLAGEVFDVIVDMRPGSKTIHEVFHCVLNPVNRLSLFIPSGVAHGYQAQMDNTEFFYMADDYYVPGIEKGVRYDDPSLRTKWPLEPRCVAERDRAWPLIQSS